MAMSIISNLQLPHPPLQLMLKRPRGCHDNWKASEMEREGESWGWFLEACIDSRTHMQHADDNTFKRTNKVGGIKTRNVQTIRESRYCLGVCLLSMCVWTRRWNSENTESSQKKQRNKWIIIFNKVDLIFAAWNFIKKVIPRHTYQILIFKNVNPYIEAQHSNEVQNGKMHVLYFCFFKKAGYKNCDLNGFQRVHFCW